MQNNPNDLYAPEPTPEEVARFRSDLDALNDDIQEHFGGKMGGKTLLLGIADYATMALQARGYAFRCSVIEAGFGEDGMILSVHLVPLTLQAAHFYILVAGLTGAKVIA